MPPRGGGPVFRPPGLRQRPWFRRVVGTGGFLLLGLGIGGAIGGWPVLSWAAVVAAGITGLAVADQRGEAGAGDTGLSGDGSHGADGGNGGDAGDAGAGDSGGDGGGSGK